MQRRDAWTLKALRALLACLCVVLAFPAASAGEPAFRPVAAAIARGSVTSASKATSEVAQATPADHLVPATPAPRGALPSAKAPRDLPARNGRHLYLEKRSLLC